MNNEKEEEIKEVLRLTKEGLTSTAVGARLNLSPAEVKRRLEAAGFPPARGWYAQALGAATLRRAILELHFEGKTPEEIAHEVKINLGYVVRRLREADLEPHAEPKQIEQAKERHEEMLALGREGVPRHKIAKRLGVPWYVVADALAGARIKPILPACSDIAAWAATLSKTIEEIRSASPNAKPILAKVDSMEHELVAISEAVVKTQELSPWWKENSERWCLADIHYLTNKSLELVDALKGCIEQRDVGKLPKLLDQAETCIKNISNIMAGAISEMTKGTLYPSYLKEVDSTAKDALEHNPLSAHCEAVLAKPPKCFDFRGVRAFVMCRAWDILEKEKRTKLPVSEAWQEARKACERE
jgi:hypothetical protein